MTGQTRSVPRLIPAVVLFLLAPFVAEASIGTVFSPSGWIAFLTLAPIYGGGAILIREAVVRRGGGYVAIALLGLGYGIVEEGLALGSLFSPTIYQAIGPRWGGELGGLNGIYTLFQLINHSLFSVTVPIALVALCFPSRQRRPWLKAPGTVLIAAVFLLGFGLARLGTSFSLDPGFSIPLTWLIISLLAIVGVVIAALGRRPSTASPDPAAGPLPRPAVLVAASLILVGIALGVLGVPAHAGLLGTPGRLPILAAMISVAAVATGIVLALRWSRRPGFDDRHRFGLAAGSLLAHQLVLGLVHPDRAVQLGVAIVLVVIIALLILLWHTVGRRSAGTVPARR